MELTRTETKMAIQAMIITDTRYFFMSRYRAYGLPAENDVPKELKEEDLRRLTFEEFSILSELIAEGHVFLCAEFNPTLHGETCYQVVDKNYIPGQANMNPVTAYNYSDEELNILRAITHEAPLEVPKPGGHPIKDISGLYDAEVHGEDDLTPYLDMDNYIPPHTVKESVNGLGLSTSPEGLKTYEWFVGDWGTEETALPEHRDTIRSLIQKGILHLSKPQKDTRYKDGGVGTYQTVYF